MHIVENTVKPVGYAIQTARGKLLADKFSGIKHLWLISERGTEARDNGWFFYKYLMEHHPEIFPVYVIDPASADFSKVSRLGGMTVRPGSWEHYAIMEAAEALISTHDCGFTPDMLTFHNFYKKGMFIPKGKRILLQNGVTDKNIPWFYREECTPDIFVVSAETERAIVTELFMQPEEVVKLTGMPRYDTLMDAEPENLVLVMPTWRQYLVNKSPESFRKSGYYLFYSDLISSEALQKVLKEYGWKMVFYPHIEMQKFHAFHADGQWIRTASFESDDVQDLLKRCRILVTDYSSVYFDAAYMGKDIIFTQFDRTSFENDHYNGCLINYEQFGTVTEMLGETEDEIREAILNPGQKRREQQDFFKWHDSRNCDRVFEEIRRTVGTF